MNFYLFSRSRGFILLLPRFRYGKYVKGIVIIIIIITIIFKCINLYFHQDSLSCLLPLNIIVQSAAAPSPG